MPKPGHRARLAAAVGGLALILAACAPMVDQRGNLPDPTKLASIQPGVTTKEAVSKLLGTPSSISTFNDKTWYYISKKTKRISFWDPEVLDQQVLAIKFDDAGIVADMRIYGLENARAIVPDPNSTPTSGRELTILQQLLGNIGRFGGSGGGMFGK